MMQLVNEADPIWGQPAKVYKVDADTRLIQSARTGNFTTDADGLSNYISGWHPIDRAKISTWILDQNRSGTDAQLNLAAIKTIEARRPLTLNQKIDRFLTMLEATRFRPGDTLPWRGGTETEETIRARHQTMLWMEAASDTEFYAFKQVLLDAEIIRFAENRLALAIGGFDRLESLQKGGPDSGQAFVAMWFDPATSAAYDAGIQPALAKAGYDAIRIDRKEHNNKIDDEIIAEIRKSRFVVADFTCGLVGSPTKPIAVARGGVYYEAGFAQGLGIPVIWTVRSDQIGLVHFDTRQFNHISWSTPDELHERLFHRISAVIGLASRAA
jgi:hypothetical protein